MASIIEIVRSGDLAGVRAAVERDPSQAAAADAAGVSALMHAQYARRDDIVSVLRAARPQLSVFEAAAVGDLRVVEAALAGDDGRVPADMAPA